MQAIRKNPPGISQRVYIAGIALALLAFALYLPALHYGYSYVDDDEYFLLNTSIRSLDIDFLQWSFTTLKTGFWLPLTWVSLALDYFFWGLNPAGYHFQNNLLHAINVFLVMILSYRLLVLFRHNHGLSDASHDFEFSVAVFTALIFGLHPLRVESVVWISERKDVLFAAFYFTCILLYLSYATVAPGRKAFWYFLLSLTAFTCALMSKPMAVTLPAVLLILDAFCLQKLDRRDPSTLRRMIINKIPFALLSVATMVITIVAQRDGGAVRTLAEVPFTARVLNAAYSLWFYVQKTLFPVDLAPLYPLRAVSLLQGEILTALVFIFAVVVYTSRALRRGEVYGAGIGLYYLITLAPVLGIIPVGVWRTADRFSYVPAIGPALLISLCIVQLSGKAALYFKASINSFLAGAGIILCVALTILTLQQMRIWSDHLLFADRVVQVSPESPQPYSDRGFVLLDRGQFNAAYRDCSHALNILHDSPDALMCRAEALIGLGRYQQALTDLSAFLRLNPVNPDALNMRGLLYLQVGDRMRAQADFAMRDMIRDTLRK